MESDKAEESIMRSPDILLVVCVFVVCVALMSSALTILGIQKTIKMTIDKTNGEAQVESPVFICRPELADRP